MTEIGTWPIAQWNIIFPLLLDIPYWLPDFITKDNPVNLDTLNVFRRVLMPFFIENQFNWILPITEIDWIEEKWKQQGGN